MGRKPKEIGSEQTKKVNIFDKSAKLEMNLPLEMFNLIAEHAEREGLTVSKKVENVICESITKSMLEFLTVEQVSNALKCSTQTVLDLIKKKELPAFKVRKTYRIQQQDYLIYMAKNKLK